MNSEEEMFTNEDMDKVVEEFEDQFQKLLLLYEVECKSNDVNYDKLSKKLKENYYEMQSNILDNHLIIKSKPLENPTLGAFICNGVKSYFSLHQDGKKH